MLVMKGWGERDVMDSIAEGFSFKGRNETGIGRNRTGSYVTRRIEKVEILITGFGIESRLEVGIL